MPLIKPISDLRNKSKQLSRLAHTANEPIFITKNGEGDMVVMSMAHYAQLTKQIELFASLAEAQWERAAGGKGRTLSQVMTGIRARLDEEA
jgi:prevent-host-death family protein